MRTNVRTKTYQEITRDTDSSFNNTTGLVDSLDTDFELVNVVEGVEDTEDIDTVLLSLSNEVVNSVVGQGRVSNTVGTTEQHLERNVGNQLAHLAETVPRILVKETHSNIESSTTPALKRVEVGESVAGLLGDVEEIDGTDSGSEERLVSIAPGSIHEQAALVLADGLGKSLRALLDENVSPTLLAGFGSINLGTVSSNDFGQDDIGLELGLADLALDRATVDSHVTQVGKKLLSSVLAADEIEERGGVVDESSPAVTVNEGGMGQERSQEGNVGLDTTDTELNKST